MSRSRSSSTLCTINSITFGMPGQASQTPVDELLTAGAAIKQHGSRGTSRDQLDTSNATSSQQSTLTGRRKRGRPRKTPPHVSESTTNPRDSTRFIHVTVGQGGRDHGAMRAIRSHAMLAVRRDQREQRRVLGLASEDTSEEVSIFPSCNSTFLASHDKTFLSLQAFSEPDPQSTSFSATSSSDLIEIFENLPLTIDNATLELLSEHFGKQAFETLPQNLHDQVQYFRKIDWPPVQDFNFVQNARCSSRL